MKHYIISITGGNPLLVPVDDEDLLAEEDDEDEVDKVDNYVSNDVILNSVNA